MVRSGLRRIGERRLELHGGEVLLSRHLFHHFDVLWRENNQEIERENDETQTYIKTHTPVISVYAPHDALMLFSPPSPLLSLLLAPHLPGAFPPPHSPNFPSDHCLLHVSTPGVTTFKILQ